MKFFDRVSELEMLKRIQQDSVQTARFTVLVGRRRIGKTELLKRAFAETGFLYLFIARRSEAELCEIFAQEIVQKLGVVIPGKVTHLSDLIALVMNLSKDRPITLVIDEFQELSRIDSGAYSCLQRDWDLLHDKMHLNLIVSGSVNRLMNKIFRDKNEPLYGRQTEFIKLKPFSLSTLKEILTFYKPNWTHEDLLALYSFTGGVAKYVELLMDNRATDRDAMLDVLLREESTFLEEGRICLNDEFGKDYGTYFSILSSIARGLTTRPQIENALGIEIGGFLKNLVAEYELVSRHQPLYDKERSKNVTYQLNDNFFTFWFRFIARYSYMLEIGAHDQLKALIKRDYNQFTGIMLERYFRAQLAESKSFTRIGSWWDRKGENEIDIIAENELSKTVSYLEVKRDASRYSQEGLEAKVASFHRATGEHQGYASTFGCLSLEDM